MMTRLSPNPSAADGLRRRLFFQALFLLLIYAAAWAVCQRFTWNASQQKPIVAFVLVMAVAFIVHLVAFRTAVRLRADRYALRLIFVVALLGRALLWWTPPVLEIDIYRYMWDGLAVQAGVNPWKYAPGEVLSVSGQVQADDLRKLIHLRDSSDEFRRTLSRVHYEHLTSIYPPVSQAVFGTAASFVSVSTSSDAHLRITKALLLVFDVFTMLAVLRLLQQFRKPVGWLIAYAWSPLVLKEVANSGHLDSIAVCLSAWAVVWWLRALQQRRTPHLLISGLLLGCAVAAKLYPVVFVPVIAAATWRHMGIRKTLISGLVFLATSAALLWPMLQTSPTSAHSTVACQSPMANARITAALTCVFRAPDSPKLPDDFQRVVTGDPDRSLDAVPDPADGDRQMPPDRAESLARQAAPGSGLTAFLSSWRMNDLVFMVIHENLLPDSDAWFSVMPRSVRKHLRSLASTLPGTDENNSAFVIARLVTALMQVVVLLCLARIAADAPLGRLPGLLFSSVAWFWFLGPTLNPWYWLWALPLVPFSRYRSWLLIGGLVFVYYLRFWLKCRFSAQVLSCVPYGGAQFFDYVVVWFEYVPFLCILLAERTVRCRRRHQSHSSAASR